MDDEILQLRIELIHTSIWRRVLVESESSFADLHQVIQKVMNWDNSQAHEFRVNKDKFIAPKQNEIEFGSRTYLNEEKEKLSEYLAASCAEITYLYDFDNDWKHQIKLEKELKTEEQDYPVCIDGEKQAPPEDCGGVPGYRHILEAVNNPEENKEILAELRGEFEPDDFNIAAINDRL